MNEVAKLHIGSGAHYAEGWVNVDVDAEWKVDVVASADNLPFPDFSFSKIYMGHFLEHIELGKLPAILAELHRVARLDCVVAVVGPCYQKAAAMGASQALLDAISVTDPIDQHPGGHKWTATTELTKSVLEACGLLVDEVPVATLHKPVWPNPAPDQAWQCAFLGKWLS